MITLKIGEQEIEIKDIDKVYEDELQAYLEKCAGAKANFKLISIKQLDGKEFYVKDYQRGYRWTATEIIDLLTDIDEIKAGDKYCMQPLTLRLAECGQKYRRKLTLGNNPLLLEVENGVTEKQTYEVIDGQQRLTTIALILSACKRKLGQDYNVNVKYAMYYEQLRFIDDYYFEKAYNDDETKERVIDKWLQEKFEEDKDGLKNFVRKVIDQLFFIWYEEKVGEKEVEALFSSINAGKIALTNAELFRAILLNSDNAKNEKGEEDKKILNQIYQIAFEWDKLEQALRDDDFWFFLSNVESGIKTRIDYLLDLYALGVCKKMKDLDGRSSLNKKYKGYFNQLDEADERFSFKAVKKYLDYQIECDSNRKVGFHFIKRAWEEIVSIYDKLYGWYIDHDLYHYIGFLVCVRAGKAGEQSASVMRKIYEKGESLTLSEMKTNVRNEIFNFFFEEGKQKGQKGRLQVGNLNGDVAKLEYGENNATLTACLLFFNLWTTMQNKTLNNRFSFRLYKTDKEKETGKAVWNIEHVNPKKLNTNLQDIKSAKEKLRYVLFMKNYLEKKGESLEIPKRLLDNIKKLPQNDDEVDADVLNEANEYWREGAGIINGHVENNIKNLVLLDETTNKGYGNDFFEAKRKQIIVKDQTSTFIPPATRNVFLKYYSKNPDEYIIWGENDQDKYLSKLKECFEEIKSWGNKA